jgi:hypothetical protein
MESTDSILVGRADRIDRNDGRLRVVDLKSGLRQGDPSADQVRQLYLYAVLVNRTRGEWPFEVSIENASGEQIVTVLDPESAEEAHREVLSAVDEFNASIRGGLLAEAAVPRAENCRFCAYRVVCPSYWTSISLDWDHRSILGTVTESGATEFGTHVTVRVASPSDRDEKEIHLSDLPMETPTSGDWIAAVDLRKVPGGSDMKGQWWSRILTL